MVDGPRGSDRRPLGVSTSRAWLIRRPCSQVPARRRYSLEHSAHSMDGAILSRERLLVWSTHCAMQLTRASTRQGARGRVAWGSGRSVCCGSRPKRRGTLPIAGLAAAPLRLRWARSRSARPRLLGLRCRRGGLVVDVCVCHRTSLSVQFQGARDRFCNSHSMRCGCARWSWCDGRRRPRPRRSIDDGPDTGSDRQPRRWVFVVRDPAGYERPRCSVPRLVPSARGPTARCEGARRVPCVLSRGPRDTAAQAHETIVGAVACAGGSCRARARALRRSAGSPRSMVTRRVVFGALAGVVPIQARAIFSPGGCRLSPRSSGRGPRPAERSLLSPVAVLSPAAAA